MKISRTSWKVLCILSRWTHTPAIILCLILPVFILVTLKKVGVDIVNLNPVLEDLLIDSTNVIVREEVERIILAALGLVIGFFIWSIFFFLFSGCPWWYIEEYTAVKAGMQKTVEHHYRDTRAYRYITHPIHKLYTKLNIL